MKRGTPTTRVLNRDLWILVLGYVRYAIGRRSTAASMARDFVRGHWAAFDDNQLAQIREEIEREHVDDLGADCDQAQWLGLIEDIKREEIRRSCGVGSRGRP